MRRLFRTLPVLACLLLSGPAIARCQAANPAARPPNIALENGKWFNGRSFEPRTVYSVDGKFTSGKPAHIDRTLDLAGLWIVPPFGNAHNHNFEGVEEWDKKAIRRYLEDGVFYVKVQGNLPLSDQAKKTLGLNQPDSIDVALAQGSMITGPGGHPAALIKFVLLPQGYYPGYTAESLVDYRYFPIGSEQELDRKWPAILAQKPDFIKVIISYSEEFEKRKDDSAYFGKRGLDPRLLPLVVEKAHAAHLRVSVHANTAADFHNAIAGGADEIAHVPVGALTPISEEDAALAAKRGVVVDTTCEVVPHIPPSHIPPNSLPQILKTQRVNLMLLRDHGVSLAIGSDTPSETSQGEVEYLRSLGIFDDLTLLKMWTETTPKSIFPGRKIGSLEDGYEASFLALEGNPLEDWKSTRRIRMQFKQGFIIQPH